MTYTRLTAWQVAKRDTNAPHLGIEGGVVATLVFLLSARAGALLDTRTEVIRLVAEAIGLGILAPLIHFGWNWALGSFGADDEERRALVQANAQFEQEARDRLLASARVDRLVNMSLVAKDLLTKAPYDDGIAEWSEMVRVDFQEPLKELAVQEILTDVEINRLMQLRARYDAPIRLTDWRVREVWSSLAGYIANLDELIGDLERERRQTRRIPSP